MEEALAIRFLVERGGGRRSQVAGEFPFMATPGWRSPSAHFCGVTLIHKDWESNPTSSAARTIESHPGQET